MNNKRFVVTDKLDLFIHKKIPAFAGVFFILKNTLSIKVNNMFKNWDNLSCIILLKGKLNHLIITAGFLRYGNPLLLGKDN